MSVREQLTDYYLVIVPLLFHFREIHFDGRVVFSELGKDVPDKETHRLLNSKAEQVIASVVTNDREVFKHFL